MSDECFHPYFRFDFVSGRGVVSGVRPHLPAGLSPCRRSGVPDLRPDMDEAPEEKEKRTKRERRWPVPFLTAGKGRLLQQS